MISDGARQIMRRKAGEGRPPPEVSVMTPARAWKAALPLAADRAAGMIAAVRSVEETRAMRDDLGEGLDDATLLVLLEGPSERFGAVFIDAQVLAGLVESMTSGRISSRPAEPRKPTATDAVLCADLLDFMLEEFEGSLEEMSDPPNLAGYRYAAPLADARAVEMTLPDGPYRIYRLELDLGSGSKIGTLTMALPAAARGAGGAADHAAFLKKLEDSVLRAPAQVEAVLHRTRLELSEVRNWQVGDVVAVPLSSLATVSIEAIGSTRLAQARLGQQGGFRAVMVTGVGERGDEAPTEAFEEAVPSSGRMALPGGDMPDLPMADGLPDLEPGLAGGPGEDLDLGDMEFPAVDIPDLD